MAAAGKVIPLPNCHQSSPTPTTSAALDINGEIAGIQNSSAALSEPKPRPIRPASRAIGAISCNCTVAMACSSGLNPGPTSVIKGSAASTSSSVTSSSKALTLVFKAARM